MEMLVPVTTGSARPARVAGTVRVPLAEGVEAGAPVSIKLRVDHDKTLRWWFSVDGGPHAEAESVDDPWASAAPTPAERELAAVRQRIRAAVERGVEVPGGLVVAEAGLLRRTGRADEALEAVEDYLEDEPGSADAHNVRGLVLSDCGRREEALAAFGEATRREPGDAVTWGNYGAQLLDCGRPGDAVPALRHALTISPGLTFVHVFLADAYRKGGDEDAARAEYRCALELARQDAQRRPESSDAWSRISYLLAALGDYGSARVARQTALDAARAGVIGGNSEMVIARTAPEDET
jgi:tetratricopeptide (TPR) repeat protein